MPFLDEDGVTRLTEDYLDIFAQKEEIGVLTKESTGEVFGPLAEVTAKGWAEQDGIPTLSNPVPIQVARGRNLLNPSDFISVAYGPNSINSYGYMSDSTPTSDSRTWEYENSNFKLSLEAGTYTVSFDIISMGTNSNSGYKVIKSDNTVILDHNDTYNSSTFTLTESTNIGIVIKVYDYVVACQLELGSTPTPYVPYGHVGLEVRGRNLIDTSRYSMSSSAEIYNYDLLTDVSYNELRFIRNIDGSITIKGTASAATIIYLPLSYIIPANTSIVVSGCPSGGSSSSYEIDLFYTDNTSTMADIGSGYTGTITKTCNRIRIRIANGVTINETFYPMLEIGSTAHAYQPYCDSIMPIPLPSKGWAGSLTNAADALTINSAGGYEWRNETWMDVLDGSETWNVQNSGKRMRTVSLSKAVRSTTSAYDTSEVLATHFPATTPNDTWYNNQLGVALDTSASTEIGILFNDGSDSMTPSTWKTWLSNNNVTVLYPLATHVNESGYVNLPEIPVNAIISIPELDQFRCKFWIDKDGSIRSMTEDYYDRIDDEKLDKDDYRKHITWGDLEDATTWGDLEGETGESESTTYTTNYHLIKPSLLTKPSITPINNNMDLLDDILDDKLDDADYRKAMTWGEVGNKYHWGVLGTSSQTTGTTYTDTLGLEKPGNNSTVDIAKLNSNYDTIDDAIEKTQESITMIESHTAQSNHAIGSYFMLDNVLHKATSAIASGETITSGANATPITIEQALTALNTSVKALQDSVGQYYSTSWTATSSSTYGTRLTDSITLPAGTYVIVLVVPTMSTTLTASIAGVSSTYLTFQSGNDSRTIIAKFTSETTIYAATAQNAAVTFTYTERGSLRVIRIA